MVEELKVEKMKKDTRIRNEGQMKIFNNSTPKQFNNSTSDGVAIRVEKGGEDENGDKNKKRGTDEHN